MKTKLALSLTLLICNLFACPTYGQERPALLPMPKYVEWHEGAYDLDRIGVITYTANELKPYVELFISEYLADEYQKGEIVLVNLEYETTLDGIQSEAYYRELESAKSRVREAGRDRGVVLKYADWLGTPESYIIDLEPDQLIITGEPAGIFYGLQTLRQLYDPAKRAFQHCTISDTPAFPWRGYMVDVGRNYQSIELLKEQIDLMAQLKLNVFHFHLTEDVAWRLQIKQYPQLTEPQYMTRDHGLSYSETEIKELQQYCADRHILFMPEIDMPGHSAAFTRAMGFGMQTPEGAEAVLNILKEVTETYDFPIIHIGGDEVKITDKNFLPTMISFLESKEIKVMGWEPGGNLTEGAIRQLWGDDGGNRPMPTSYQHVDSRNLYINHHDALETLPLIFNHPICNVPSATESALGATLCLWNDRRLREGYQNLTHNPTIPALIGFSEKAWVGGGEHYSHVHIIDTPPLISRFKDFEKRVIEIHRKQFSHLPFQYVAQGDIRWDIYGPYDNGGDLSRVFPPERQVASPQQEPSPTLLPDTTLVGGTIIIRHFWNPAVKGHYTDILPNSTIYASRKVWSDIAREAEMWIGFYDISRSQATPTPPAGAWTQLGPHCKIWLNAEEIAPPKWLRAGQDGGNNEYPLEDENYYMRPPQKVHLKEGWNTIFIKAPIGNFNGPTWFAPNKWMFTAVIL